MVRVLIEMRTSISHSKFPLTYALTVVSPAKDFLEVFIFTFGDHP